MSKEDLVNALQSMKGISGTGKVLAEFADRVAGLVATMEPGDFISSELPATSTAPIGYDLWYLWASANMMTNYYPVKIDGDHYDYTPYITANLAFLGNIKPLRVYRDLSKQLTPNVYFDVYSMTIKNDWISGGIYWINTMAFELCNPDISPQYPSIGSNGYKAKANDYVGYISIPIGQIGVQEIISLMQETKLSGYKFTAVDSLSGYYTKAAVVLSEGDKSVVQTPPDMFPTITKEFNQCYGRHLIENAYYIPTTPAMGQNTDSPASETVRTASDDVELSSKEIIDYGEDVKPKLWMRYWIHKESTLPVPGEFIGILCKPVTTPPHVWWYQETTPFLYAGNWVETKTLTSGVIVSVILEKDRNGEIGNAYNVKVHGCEVQIVSTDFFLYSVGDRVAIIKTDKVEAAKATKSYRWLDQVPIRETDSFIKKGTILTNCVISPLTYFKKI